MANEELFTRRNGEQIPVPEIIVPKSVMTSVMRLREDYLIRGVKLSLNGCLLEMLSKGDYTIRAHWKAAAKNKEMRDTGKNVKEYIRVQLALGKPIDSAVICQLTGQQMPKASAPVVEEYDDSILDGDVELTDEQLEQATAPSGVA